MCAAAMAGMQIKAVVRQSARMPGMLTRGQRARCGTAHGAGDLVWSNQPAVDRQDEIS